MSESKLHLTLDNAVVTSALENAAEGIDAAIAALAPLVKIADAYDDNNLDDEARKRWGRDEEFTNQVPPEQIILYTGRGGGTLLTLADCLAARKLVKGV